MCTAVDNHGADVMEADGAWSCEMLSPAMPVLSSGGNAGAWRTHLHVTYTPIALAGAAGLPGAKGEPGSMGPAGARGEAPCSVLLPDLLSSRHAALHSCLISCLSARQSRH